MEPIRRNNMSAEVFGHHIAQLIDPDMRLAEIFGGGMAYEIYQAADGPDYGYVIVLVAHGPSIVPVNYLVAPTYVAAIEKVAKEIAAEEE